MITLETTMPFGEQLKTWRKAAGLTQEELADLTGYTKAYISNIERNAPHSTTGALPEPSHDFLRAISNALKRPYNVVFAAAYPEDASMARPGVIVVREDQKPITADQDGNIVDLDQMEENARQLLKDIARLRTITWPKTDDK